MEPKLISNMVPVLFTITTVALNILARSTTADNQQFCYFHSHSPAALFVMNETALITQQMYNGSVV